MTLDLVTGSFSYSGRFLTERLLQEGRQVRSLTNHPRPELFDGQVATWPLRFDDQTLLEALSGVDTVYNTYWVRFAHAGVDFETAVQNSKALVAAARTARVRRFVQVSIANPSADSPFPYYRGKAAVEQHLMDSGLSYAIVRPTVLYGEGDVLMNNIAWFIRHVPVFGIPGSGCYRIQPVFVRDHTDLMRTVGMHDENVVIDSVGPDVYTFDALLRRIRRALDCHTVLVNVPAPVALRALQLLGVFVHDRILTDEEIRALMDDLLISHAAPTCPTRFDTWLRSHAHELGHSFASELQRHFARQSSYTE